MGKLFPKIYDAAMAPLEQRQFKNIRASLIGEASGKVLEIGSGTGINFSYYKYAEHVDAIEPNPLMMAQTAKRIKDARVPIATHIAKAENLPFGDGVYDTIVATLVFCTIPEPEKALQEIKRVSKPGAKFLLFEHVRMNQKLLGKTQDLLTPAWKKLCDGCHLNRNTLELLKQSGFIINNVEKHYNGLFLTITCTIAKE